MNGAPGVASACPRESGGLHVERLALEVLLGRGHTVAMAARNDHHDLVANGVRVEVKAARFACPRESGGAARRLPLQHAPE